MLFNKAVDYLSHGKYTNGRPRKINTEIERVELDESERGRKDVQVGGTIILL